MRITSLPHLLAFAVTVASFTAPAAEWSGPTAVIALKPDKDPDAMLAERKTLSETLSKSLGCKVDVIVPLSAAVIAEGLRNGSIDAAYVSATEAVSIVDSGAGAVQIANEIDGKTSYSSLWVTLSDATYESIDDLKAKPVAFSSRTSTSGFLIPVLDLNQRGHIKSAADLESYFGRGNTLYGTGYVSAIEMVLNGSAEAAAVSDYVLLGDKHLDETQKSKLKKLQSQGPVPSHVIVTSTKLSADNQAALTAAVLDLDAAETAALRDRIFTAKFVKVDEDAHLKPIRQALSLTGQGQ